jgi:hypothetical protein
VREAFKGRKEPWTEAELSAATPQMLTNRSEWKVTASLNSQAAPLAIDGDIGTRYDTAQYQVPGMWFQVELPQTAFITGLRLNAGGSAQDYPRGCKVELSDDGKTWGQSVLMRPGNHAVTDVFFKPTEGKFIRITQTGKDGSHFWSIHELTVYTPGVVAKTPSTKPALSQYE